MPAPGYIQTPSFFDEFARGVGLGLSLRQASDRAKELELETQKQQMAMEEMKRQAEDRKLYQQLAGPMPTETSTLAPGATIEEGGQFPSFGQQPQGYQAPNAADTGLFEKQKPTLGDLAKWIAIRSGNPSNVNELLKEQFQTARQTEAMKFAEKIANGMSGAGQGSNEQLAGEPTVTPTQRLSVAPSGTTFSFGQQVSPASDIQRHGASLVREAGISQKDRPRFNYWVNEWTRIMSMPEANIRSFEMDNFFAGLHNDVSNPQPIASLRAGRSSQPRPGNIPAMDIPASPGGFAVPPLQPGTIPSAPSPAPAAGQLGSTPGLMREGQAGPGEKYWMGPDGKTWVVPQSWGTKELTELRQNYGKALQASKTPGSTQKAVTPQPIPEAQIFGQSRMLAIQLEATRARALEMAKEEGQLQSPLGEKAAKWFHPDTLRQPSGSLSAKQAIDEGYLPVIGPSGAGAADSARAFLGRLDEMEQYLDLLPQSTGNFAVDAMNAKLNPFSPQSSIGASLQSFRDPRISNFENLRKSTAQAAKAFGDAANIAVPEQKQIQSQLPGFGVTKEVAKANLDQMRRLIYTAASRGFGSSDEVLPRGKGQAPTKEQMMLFLRSAKNDIELAKKRAAEQGFKVD